MSEFDIPEKYKVIKKGLIKLGLTYRAASKHDVATCPETNRKTTVPRHVIIKKATVSSICKFLIENGYEREKIKNAFKWK